MTDFSQDWLSEALQETENSAHRAHHNVQQTRHKFTCSRCAIIYMLTMHHNSHAHDEAHAEAAALTIEHIITREDQNRKTVDYLVEVRAGTESNPSHHGVDLSLSFDSVDFIVTSPSQPSQSA